MKIFIKLKKDLEIIISQKFIILLMVISKVIKLEINL